MKTHGGLSDADDKKMWGISLYVSGIKYPVQMLITSGKLPLGK